MAAYTLRNSEPIKPKFPETAISSAQSIYEYTQRLLSEQANKN